MLVAVLRTVHPIEVGSPRDLRPGAPTDPDVRISRIVCWRPHTMRYVAGLVMWRDGRLPTRVRILGRIFTT